MTQDLWTPAGTVPLGAAPVGNNAETGSPIVAHTIMLKATDKFGKEHKMRVQVLADKDTSQAEVEDMMGMLLRGLCRKSGISITSGLRHRRSARK